MNKKEIKADIKHSIDFLKFVTTHLENCQSSCDEVVDNCEGERAEWYNSTTYTLDEALQLINELVDKLEEVE